ncbi:hypothetical protein SH2C18_03820 [Clostridium sediminicola]|uniref:hypothetical protein n=1 Tax=Clostridium sediminicola TaxID=3114879 RepID=UPI0031F2367F
MAFPRLKQFASKMGWRIEKGIAYGEENGYLFTLIDGPGFKMFLTPLPSVTEEIKNEILDYLNENKKELQIHEFLFDDDVLAVKLKESFKSASVEVMNNLVSELTNFLKSKGVNGKGCCIFCGIDNAEQTVYIDNLMFSAHDECYSREVAAMDEAAKEYDEEDKNYGSGIIGALLGGIVSSIPWVISQVYFESMAVVFAILISLGSLKAYYLFKGELGRATKWIVAFSTLFSVVLAQFGVMAIIFIKYKIPVEYESFVRLFKDPEMANIFKVNLRLGLFMASLGIIRLFFELKGDAKSFLPTMEKK